MIERIYNEIDANTCDTLLTKLIRDEKKYDNTVEEIEVKDYFKNVIQDKNNILLGYKENNRVVGYIYLKHMGNNEYLIDGLYVEVEYRNKGIGKVLLQSGIDVLKELRCDHIDIKVLYANEVAMKLYKYIGFEEYRVTMRKKLN